MSSSSTSYIDELNALEATYAAPAAPAAASAAADAPSVVFELFAAPTHAHTRLLRALATYVGVELRDASDFVAGRDSPPGAPFARLPVLRSPDAPADACVFGLAGALELVARASLRAASLCGSTPLAAAQIGAWRDFARAELDLPAAAWLSPIRG